MKESAGQPIHPPLRPWRPMAAWTAGMGRIAAIP